MHRFFVAWQAGESESLDCVLITNQLDELFLLTLYWNGEMHSCSLFAARDLATISHKKEKKLD